MTELRLVSTRKHQVRPHPFSEKYPQAVYNREARQKKAKTIIAVLSGFFSHWLYDKARHKFGQAGQIHGTLCLLVMS